MQIDNGTIRGRNEHPQNEMGVNTALNASGEKCSAYHFLFEPRAAVVTGDQLRCHVPMATTGLTTVWPPISTRVDRSIITSPGESDVSVALVTFEPVTQLKRHIAEHVCSLLRITLSAICLPPVRVRKPWQRHVVHEIPLR